MRRLLSAVVAVFVLALGTAVLTTAQDAVEGDGDEVNVTNELGTPCAVPEGTPAASPMASPEGSPFASPEASPMASPMASPDASPNASPVAIVIPGCPTEEGTPDAG